MLVVWTLVGAVVLSLLLKYFRRKQYNLPPGPRGLPFIGNVFQLDKSGPHKTITKWSEEYGDVFKMKAFGRNSIVLNSFETIYEGLVTQANSFAGRHETYRLQTFYSHCPGITITDFSPKWVYMKKTAMQVLKMYGENLENLEVITLHLIEDMLNQMKELSANGPFDHYPIYNKCTTGIITSIIFGKKLDETTAEAILRANTEDGVLIEPTGVKVLLDLMPWLRHFPNKTNADLIELAKTLKHIIDKQNKERKVECDPKQPLCFVDGLLDHQIRSKKKPSETQLTDPDIFGITLDLILADWTIPAIQLQNARVAHYCLWFVQPSHSDKVKDRNSTFTTTTTLNALFAVLVNKPEIQKKMATEIKEGVGNRVPRLTDRKLLHYTEAAILEILRYSSITPLNLPHRTMVDTTIGGYDIPKDTEVFFNLWKLHHSADYWNEPWEFKPERFLDENNMVVTADHINRRRHMSFGASRRVCVGETLAKNRLFLMVVSLLQHFEFLPAGPDEIPRHDPRDYKPVFGIEPYKYRINLVPRQ